MRRNSRNEKSEEGERLENEAQLFFHHIRLPGQ